jgi:hypothetical protein
MNDDQQKQMLLELLSYGANKRQATRMLDQLHNLTQISEASQRGNISRNVPLDETSKIRLERIKNSTKKFLDELNKLTANDDLKLRLHLLDGHIQKTAESVKVIYDQTCKTLENQAATGQSAYLPGHLRPEYRGKRITKHKDIEYLGILNHVLMQFFPEIKPTKNQDQSDKFFKLAAVLLDKKDPRRAINRYLEISSQTYDV